MRVASFFRLKPPADGLIRLDRPERMTSPLPTVNAGRDRPDSNVWQRHYGMDAQGQVRVTYHVRDDLIARALQRVDARC